MRCIQIHLLIFIPTFIHNHTNSNSNSNSILNTSTVCIRIDWKVNRHFNFIYFSALFPKTPPGVICEYLSWKKMTVAGITITWFWVIFATRAGHNFRIFDMLLLHTNNANSITIVSCKQLCRMLYYLNSINSFQALHNHYNRFDKIDWEIHTSVGSWIPFSTHTVLKWHNHTIR